MSTVQPNRPLLKPDEGPDLNKIKAVAFDIFGVLFLSPLYLIVTSEGIRHMMPLFGNRLSKIVGLLSTFGLRKLDWAHIASIVVMVFIIGTWNSLLRHHILKDGDTSDKDIVNADERHALFMIFGIPLLFADIMAFFYGATKIGSWGGTDYFAAVILTVIYGSLIVLFSYYNVLFWAKVKGGKS